MASRIRCLVLLLAASAAGAAPQLWAQGQCGPIILAGHDADDHGFEPVYAGLFNEILANVANGNSGILAIGTDVGSWAALWIQNVGSLMTPPQSVTFVNDSAIATVDFSPHAILMVPSDNLDTSGGISQAEADLLTGRSYDIAVFQNGGGGLFGLTQGELTNGWSWIGGVGAFSHLDVPPSGTLPSLNLFDNVGSTPEGQRLGIYDTNLDGCCFHNVFTSYPAWLRPLAWADEPADPAYHANAVFVGGVNRCIQTCVVPPRAVAAPAPPACLGATLRLDGSASTACSPAGLMYRWMDGASEVCPWSSQSYCDVAPATRTTFTLEVYCADARICSAADSVTVDVLPAPSARLEPLPALCASGSIVLDASASAQPSCPGPLEFRFQGPGGPLQGWGSSATCGPLSAPPAGTYTAEVRCPAAPGCPASATRQLVLETPPRAALLVPGPSCAPASVTLDATGSLPGSCPVALEYRFLAGSTLLRDWSSSPTLGPLAASLTTLYTVEARCPAPPGCGDAIEATLQVVPPPRARAGPDASVCEGVAVTLSGSASTTGACPGGALFEWREGSTVLRAAGPSPDWTPPTTLPGLRTYTLVVTCAAPPSCAASDEVTVVVRGCPLAVSFASVAARLDPASAAIEVTWMTSAERDTLGFMVERAPAPGGPFAAVSGLLPAQGAWVGYRFLDPSGLAAGGRPTYRVVEQVSGGRGDVSPGVELAGAPGSAARGRARARRRTK